MFLIADKLYNMHKIRGQDFILAKILNEFPIYLYSWLFCRLAVVEASLNFIHSVVFGLLCDQPYQSETI